MGGFSVSVVMSWIIGTRFAILYQFPGTPNESAPRRIPVMSICATASRSRANRSP